MHVTFDIFCFEGSWKFICYHPLYNFQKTCENSLSSLPFISQVETRPLKTPTEFCQAKVKKHRNVKIPYAFYLPFSQRLRTFWAFVRISHSIMQISLSWNSLTLLDFTYSLKKKTITHKYKLINGLSGLKWCPICSPVLCRGDIAWKCGGSNVLCKLVLFV